MGKKSDRKKKSASFLPSSALKARELSYAAGSCCLVNDCCPPLPLRSCCHPSESPRLLQSSPADDSLLVLLAVGFNIRDAPDKYKNTVGAGMNKRSKFGDRGWDNRRRILFFSLSRAFLGSTWGEKNNFGTELHSACTAFFPPQQQKVWATAAITLFPHLVSHPLLP